METIAPFKEIIEEVKAHGGDAFKRCFQCGLCDSVCPWNKVRQFSIRKIVREATFGLTDIESEEMWRCTTCGRCPQLCPRDVKQIESGVALRRIATEYGVFPHSVQPIKSIRGSLVGSGNPLNEERSKRADWARDLDVKPFAEGTEILYFPDCYCCYDPRMKKVAVATAKILNAAGVDFGILGDKEVCCGESIRKAGDEEVFQRLAKENIKAFIDAGVKKILVSSPHCYHTFKNEYPEFMVNFEVIHITQYLAELIGEGRLKLDPDKVYEKKVTWHDPCYLGRHNGIYDEPRNVLQAVPGLEFTELPEHHVASLCCAGGGGRIWMETIKGERFCDLRIDQAVDVGAEVLVTACPYCITNFEDSRVTMGLDDRIEVKEITEVISELI